MTTGKPRSLMSHFVSGRGVEMLFMPGDPLNSGGKSQGWFLDVLGHGRVEQRLFTLPTGKFLNVIYGVLLDDFWELFPYSPGLRHHGNLPMRGLVA